MVSETGTSIRLACQIIRDDEMIRTHRMGEEDDVAVTSPLVEINLTLGGGGLEVRSDRAQAKTVNIRPVSQLIDFDYLSIQLHLNKNKKNTEQGQRGRFTYGTRCC